MNKVTSNCDKDNGRKYQGYGNKTNLVVAVVRGRAYLRKWLLNGISKDKEETGLARTGLRALQHMQRL